MTKRWKPSESSNYHLTEWTYDNAGRVTLESNYFNSIEKNGDTIGGAATNAYTYNIDSEISEIISNNVGKTTYIYDNDGHVSRKTELLSGARTKRTDYTHDFLGRVASETMYQEQNSLDGKPDNTTLFGLTTSYSYDANGNLITVVYPNGAILNYEYDALNRQTVAKRAVLN